MAHLPINVANVKGLSIKRIMKQNKLRPIVKTHGGKWYLKDFVIDNFPENYQDLVYCEPFCAGASIFLNKKPSVEEVISDIDKNVIAIFKALRDESKEFINRLKRIQYTERSFKIALTKSKKPLDDYIDRGVNEYILRRMSRGGLKKAFAWSNRTRGDKPGDVNSWDTMLKQLPKISERLRNVTILCSDFREIIKYWDEENTLMYLDPPYLHSTRTATDVYENEMTVEDHIDLLNLIKNSRGKVIISGYSSPLYNRTLKGWKCKKKSVANHSSQAKTKDMRTEVVWFNY
jgi:DNA adenine methylase